MDEVRLIDANALEDRCNNYLWDDNEYEHITSFIADEPTIEAEPVKHGHWIEITQHHTQCSCCEVTCLIAVYPISAHANYCPNCGAKMDGDNHD